jgi:hypothetical protein
MTPAEILQDFADQVEAIIKDELRKIGLPEKYPSGQPVKLTNSVNGVADMFKILVEINDYYIWVVRGRRPRAQNPSGKPPPFSKIREWVGRRKFQFSDKRGRLLSFDRTAWIVRAAVWKNGVKGRDFITPANRRIVEAYGERLADPLFLSIVNSICKNIPVQIVPILTK